MSSGTRRRAREAALKILFQMDLAGGKAGESIDAYWECFDLEAAGGSYAEDLVRGFADHSNGIDETIRGASTRWRLERMALVDRNVLRIGTFELLHCDDVPTRVVLDEAIELAKRYGAEDSSAFVNGVLDRIARDSRGSVPDLPSASESVEEPVEEPAEELAEELGSTEEGEAEADDNGDEE